MLKMIVGQYTICVFAFQRVVVWKDRMNPKGYSYEDYPVYDPIGVIRWNNDVVEELIELYEGRA